ncbi:MAG TPA: hypothetical protein VKE97_02110 [Acidimicrobiia bacterium]|nr:hypothetical protein [Acidimicrobiia bacterium]
MGARSGRRTAVVVVTITVVLVATVLLAVARGANRRVILYGDSLAFESRDAFALALQRGNDIEVVDRTYGGTAICDRLDRMRQDLHDLQPAAVVIEFAGNNVTPCMQGPDGPLTGAALAEKYRDDARTATDIFAGAGVRVYWIGAPPITASQAGDFARVRRLYEAQAGGVTQATPPFGAVEYVDADRAVVDGGRFTATLPCLPSEGPAEGCVDGRIPVRALDGVHFCPVRTGPGTDHCPVYSSGAVRFGLAMAGPVRRDLLGR